MRRTHIAALPTILVLSALALTGCAAGSSSTVSNIEAGGAPAPQVQPFSDGNSDTVTDGGSDSKAEGDSPIAVDRQVIETGYVTVVVDKPLDAVAEAGRITEQSGGRVDGRTEYGATDYSAGSATLTLRIPAAALDATLEKLKALGTVQEVSLSSTDVTLEYQDLDARINAKQAALDKFVALLATATDTDTLITLETAISDRQGELDSMKSQQRYLADQVAMSTVTLNLVSAEQAPVAKPGNFFDGLQVGWAAFLAFFAGLVVVLGVLLPWLVLIAIIVAVIVTLVRRSRRRRASREAVATAPAQAEPSTAPTAAVPAEATPAKATPAKTAPAKRAPRKTPAK